MFAADLDLAESLILDGRASRAYEQLVAEEFEQAGNVEFDYLLGLAALESGRPAAATLAFERVLALEPDFVGARLDMARAYFQLGNLDLAEREFDELDKLSPPPSARAVIDQYRAAIADQKNPSKTSALAYIEVALGHDSNVSTATDTAEIAIPALGGTVTLSDSSLQTGDTYLRTGLGAKVHHQATEAIAFVGGANVRHQSLSNEHEFEDRGFDANVGVEAATKQFVFAARASIRRDWLGSQTYRRVPGVSGNVRYTLDQHDSVMAFAGFDRVRYDAESSISESGNVTIGGLAWLHAFGDSNADLFVLTAFGGLDNDVSTRADGDKRIFGSRVLLEFGMNPDLNLLASFGVQHSRYDARNSLFEVKRNDTFSDASIAGQWRPARNWLIAPVIRYSRSFSNIDIYDYDRWDVHLSVRRELTF